jgi:hypothetical protein
VVSEEHLTLEQTLFAQIAEVHQHDSAFVEADSRAFHRHRDGALLLGLEQKVVVGEARGREELLEVLDGAGA